MKKSAGIILYRLKTIKLEVFLVHPGGPFWTNKDEGSWSIPKGEFTDNEDALDAAKREIEEETGIKCDGTFLELNPIKQKSGKQVYAWALEMDVNENKIQSNMFEIEWPPKSGQYKSFPEIDKGKWFFLEEAKQKLNPSQIAFIDELILKLNKSVS